MSGVAAVFSTMVAWRNLGLPRLMFSPEAPIHAWVEALSSSTATPGSWCVLDQAWWRAHPLGMLWPEMDTAA